MVKNMIVYSCSGKPICEGCYVKIQERNTFLSCVNEHTVAYPENMDSDLRFAKDDIYKITKFDKGSNLCRSEYFIELNGSDRVYGVNDYWYISNFMVEPVIDEKYIEFIKNLKENDLIWAINSL